MADEQPFLTFLTPTYQRPFGLARCLESVQQQTAVAAIEHIVFPDHIGVGIGGMFQNLPRYGEAAHGRYIHILQDDDVLATPKAVEYVQQFAERKGWPPLVLVTVLKGDVLVPAPNQLYPWPPRINRIDLGCMVVRADNLAHVRTVLRQRLLRRLRLRESVAHRGRAGGDSA